MALFSRRHRSQDLDNVRLASPDHAWWNGEEPEGPTGPDLGSTDEIVDPWAGAPGPDHDGVPGVDAAERSAAERDATERGEADGVEPAGQLDGATATDEAARGADADDAPGPFGRPAEVSGRFEADPDPESLGRGVDGELFVVDGLPDQDRMVELVGALGLEPDADWVDIARAHRRLATVSPGGGDWDDERQRRSANEAYASLRLFHH